LGHDLGVDPVRVLFVCMGNICRSPMAEAVFLELLRRRGLESRFEVDSAGTGGWHAGERADPRTLATLTRHGIDYSGRARQVRPHDFDHYDYILAMDDQNLIDLRAWQAFAPDQVSLLLSWDPSAPRADVPDPYYGGPDGFEMIYALITSACEAFLDQVLAKD
jgi:protein-tyrosine phosphatase